MNKNVVYVFTGTGNSLKIAKNIAAELGDCDIFSMGNNARYDLAAGYKTIGFVFPTYYRGEPGIVNDFINRLNLQNNKNSYFYAVATAGGYEGNALYHIKKLLKKKGISLHYGKALYMFSNYVVSYEMKDTAAEEAKKAEIDSEPVIKSVRNREINNIPGMEPIQEIAYKAMIPLVSEMDKFYSVSGDCIKCGICEKVCPVDNIVPDDTGRPVFYHRCEQCMACIQFCPKKAINYKDKTQNRKRYTHPAIKYTDLALLYGKGDADRRQVRSIPEKKKTIGGILLSPIAKAIWAIYKM